MRATTGGGAARVPGGPRRGPLAERGAVGLAAQPRSAPRPRLSPAFAKRSSSASTPTTGWPRSPSRRLPRALHPRRDGLCDGGAGGRAARWPTSRRSPSCARASRPRASRRAAALPRLRRHLWRADGHHPRRVLRRRAEHPGWLPLWGVYACGLVAKAWVPNNDVFGHHEILHLSVIVGNAIGLVIDVMTTWARRGSWGCWPREVRDGGDPGGPSDGSPRVPTDLAHDAGGLAGAYVQRAGGTRVAVLDLLEPSASVLGMNSQSVKKVTPIICNDDDADAPPHHHHRRARRRRDARATPALRVLHTPRGPACTTRASAIRCRHRCAQWRGDEPTHRAALSPRGAVRTPCWRRRRRRRRRSRFGRAGASTTTSTPRSPASLRSRCLRSSRTCIQLAARAAVMWVYVFIDGVWIYLMPHIVGSPKILLGHHLATLLVVGHVLTLAPSSTRRGSPVESTPSSSSSSGTWPTRSAAFHLSWLAIRTVWFPLAAAYFLLAAGGWGAGWVGKLARHVVIGGSSAASACCSSRGRAPRSRGCSRSGATRRRPTRGGGGRGGTKKGFL